MAKVLLGYNIGIRVIDGATESIVVGTTSNNLSISPKLKERITKDDNGFKRSTKTGYNYEFTVEALSQIKDTGETEVMDRDDIIDLALALGDAAEFEFYYGPIEPGSAVKKGKAIISNFSEASDSENDATISISCTGVTELTDYTIPVA